MKYLRKITLVLLVFFFLTFFPRVKAQKRMTVTGDSLVGKIENGEKLREVIGNVVIFDETGKITCDKAVQHLESGNIDLFGNVIFIGDTLKLFTERAKYFASAKLGIIDTNLLMITGFDSVSAEEGKYLLEKREAYFFGNVKAETGNRILFSDTLIYFEREKKMYAEGNVVVSDSASKLCADSLYYDTETEITRAYGNVCLRDKEKNTVAVSDFMLDSARTLHSILSENSMVMQVDSSNGAGDTLLVEALRFDVFRDSVRRIVARDSVKMARGNFLLVADSVFFNSHENYFTAVKNEKSHLPVVLWFEKLQICGDTMTAFLSANSVERMKITGNVLLVEEVDSARFRYNQISGEEIELFFENNSLAKMKTSGKVLSIYYLDDEGGARGLIKSSSNSALIEFENSKVAKVKLFGNPNSEFHPEKLTDGKERDFLLPTFELIDEKPSKEILLRKIKSKLKHETKNFVY